MNYSSLFPNMLHWPCFIATHFFCVFSVHNSSPSSKHLFSCMFIHIEHFSTWLCASVDKVYLENLENLKFTCVCVCVSGGRLQLLLLGCSGKASKEVTINLMSHRQPYEHLGKGIVGRGNSMSCSPYLGAVFILGTERRQMWLEQSKWWGNGDVGKAGRG